MELVICTLVFAYLFNNARTVTNKLDTMGVGWKIGNYIATFLLDRTATIHVKSEHSLSHALESFGTSQVSVLSILRLNIAVMLLARTPRSIPDLRFSLYTTYTLTYTFHYS